MRRGPLEQAKYVKGDIIQNISPPYTQFLVLGISADATYYKLKNLSNNTEFWWGQLDANGLTKKVN